MGRILVTEREIEHYHQGLLSNYRDLRGSQWWRFHNEIVDAAERAVKAGGEAPLEFIGIGAQGVVLCDRHHAFKVGRNWGTNRVRNLEDEAEWLMTASQIREVRPFVAAFIDWNKKLGVLTRECPRGTSGTWGASEKVRATFNKVEPYMLAAGWGMPEFKEDSVVFTGGRAQIVDAGFPHRISNRLVSFVESVLEGRRRREPADFEDSLSDLSFELRRELTENPKAIARGRMEPPLDERRARSILEKLYALGASRG